MRLNRLHLAGFGRLRAFEREFAAGLNVVLGPNEAGKSTLLRAIEAMLYGPPKDARQRSGNETLQRYRPWDGGAYGGELDLILANGERYRIERRLDLGQTRIYREPGAMEVTRTYQAGRRGWVDFAEPHLGLSPGVFQSSACLHQDSLILDKNDVGVLHAHLDQLADTGGTEQSSVQAISRLDQWIKEKINPSAHRTDLSPLKKTQKEVADLQSDLETSRAALEGVATLAAEEQQLIERVACLGQEIEQLDRLIAGRELREIESKLDQLARLDAGIDAGQSALRDLADTTGYDEDALNHAQQLLRDLDRLERTRTEDRATVEAEQGDYHRAEQCFANVATMLATLPEVSTSDLDAAFDAIRDWQSRADTVGRAADEATRCRERYTQHKAAKDPRIASLNGSNLSTLTTVIDQAASSREQYSQAARHANADPIDPSQSAELNGLEAQLADLSAQTLGALREATNRLRAAEGDLPSTGSGPILALIATIVGLVAGYVASGPVGALAGGVVLAAIAYAVSVYPVARRRSTAIEELQKDRARLAQQLATYEVDSIETLQTLWNRRGELREEIGQALRLQETLAVARREYAQAQEDLAERFGLRDVDQARALLQQWQDWEADRERLDHALTEATRFAGEATHGLTTQRAAAILTLERVGVRATDPSTAQRGLQTLREQQQQRQELLRERGELRLQLESFQARQRALATAEAEFILAEDTARDAFAALGINVPPATRPAALERAMARLRQRQGIEKSLEITQASRRTLLGNDDPETLRIRSAELRTVASEPADDDTRTLDALRGLRQQRSREKEQVLTKRAESSAIRSERLKGLAEPAEIEERLAEASQRLARLERLHQTLRDAREVIGKVAEEHRRGFAPRLGASVGGWLEQVTDGRYRTVEVSPENLDVHLESTERGGRVTLDQVSGGTRDAIMLLLRVSVVDLLSSTNEPVPLFLDDPLVNVDPVRTQNLLAILAGLASQRQIFYFTQDPRIAEWIGPNGTVHELTPGVADEA